jgi:hypothetical protein
MLHTLTYTSKLTVRGGKERNFTTKEMISIFPLWTFHLYLYIYINIPAAPAYEVYISQLIRYSRACVSYQDFLDRGLLLPRNLLNQGFLLVKLKWSPLCNICVTNDHGNVSLVINTSRSFPHSRLITGLVTRLTRWVSLVEEELLTLPEHLMWPPVFSLVRETRSLVLWVGLVDRCLSFCTFALAIALWVFFDIRFWLRLWYLQTLLNVGIPVRNWNLTHCQTKGQQWYMKVCFRSDIHVFCL